MPPFHHADTAMKAQTVILAMPPIFGIHQVIAENLRFHGFEVTELIYEEGKFTYANIWQRLKKLFYRNLLRQREYKKEQLFQPYLADFTAKLDQIEGQADYCFMIWPGVFPSSFMQTLRDKSRLMLHYNWETLEFLEHEFYKIKFFDKFMFFDPYDIGRRPEYADKLIPATSFWFDCYLQEEQNDGSLFFIGSHHKERIADIRAFYLAAESIGLPTDFRIVSKNPQEAEQELALPGVRYLSSADALPYRDNLLAARKAGVLVDFLHTKHHGLSLRVFEALGYGKKLITTNPTVVHYDFYHPDNIFVWSGGNTEELKAFLQHPYSPPPEALKQKYSFDNWIRWAFDIEPHQAIGLPHLPPQQSRND